MINVLIDDINNELEKHFSESDFEPIDNGRIRQLSTTALLNKEEVTIEEYDQFILDLVKEIKHEEQNFDTDQSFAWPIIQSNGIIMDPELHQLRISFYVKVGNKVPHISKMHDA